MQWSLVGKRPNDRVCVVTVLISATAISMPDCVLGLLPGLGEGQTDLMNHQGATNRQADNTECAHDQAKDGGNTKDGLHPCTGNRGTDDSDQSGAGKGSERSVRKTKCPE
jgi:hypothetical protein